MARTEPARGMRDFLPEDVRRRNYVIDVITRVYERYGFEPLETPAYENIETLLGKYGEEGNKLIFKILKRGEHEASGEADLALRYDLTVPLARVEQVREIMGLPPLNMFDALANDFSDCFTDKPDFTPYAVEKADPRLFDWPRSRDKKDPNYRLARTLPTIQRDTYDRADRRQESGER